MAARRRRGRHVKLRAGGFLPWPRPPSGSRVPPDRPREPAGVAREPPEGAVVRELLRRYAQAQETLGGLSTYWLHRGSTSPRGKRCGRSAPRRGVLSHPTYTGHVDVHRPRWRPARRRRSATHPRGTPAAGRAPAPPEEWTCVTTIPALVRQADVDDVQATLGLHHQRASRNNTVHAYWLRALVRWGRWQAACTALTSASGQSYDRCWRAVPGLDAQADARCHARYRPADQLEALVGHALGELLAHPEWMRSAWERAHGGHW